MISLQKTFISGAGGFGYNPLKYEQLKRTATVAIYRRSRDHSSKDFQDFEVFRIKVTPKGTHIFNTIIEDDTEKYPSQYAFGHTAWSYRNKLAALDKFEELTTSPTNSSMPADDDMAEDRGDDDAPAVTLPKDGFTIAQYATRIGLPYSVAYLKLKEAIGRNEIQFSHAEREQGKKGRATNIYTMV